MLSYKTLQAPRMEARYTTGFDYEHISNATVPSKLPWKVEHPVQRDSA